jgi:hypothetical protein
MRVSDIRGCRRIVFSALRHKVILIRIVRLIDRRSGSRQALGRLCELSQFPFHLQTGFGIALPRQLGLGQTMFP